MPMLTPQHVQDALDQLGLDIAVQVFDVSTATSQQAAEAAGCELGAIAKSLCFLVNEQPVIVVTAGDQRVDTRKMAALYGVGRKKVKMADAETTLSLTGYTPGGVPPLGHVQPLKVLIDATLGRFELIYAAAGAPNAIFPVPFQTLVQASSGQVVDIAEE
jgi:Cys-tRNA(Pro) deacylase